MIKEKAIQNAIIQYLNLVPGCMAVTYFNGAVFDAKRNAYRRGGSDRPNGFPDIIGSYKGKAFAIEVKSSVGQLTESQRLMHDKMRLKGWPVCLCRSIEHAKEFLATL